MAMKEFSQTVKVCERLIYSRPHWDMLHCASARKRILVPWLWHVRIWTMFSMFSGGVWFADGHGLARMLRTGPLRPGSPGARAA
jgi:hypothetical protein